MNEQWNREFLETLLPAKRSKNLFNTYFKKIPPGVTITSLTKTALEMGGLEQFITKDFSDSSYDQGRTDPRFLIQLPDGRYQVFEFERLLKHLAKEFTSLEDAFNYWLHIELGSLGEFGE